MTTPATIETYGAPAGGYLDAFPVEDPTVEISATYDNRALEDCAQMTRTTDKAVVRFTTSTGGAGTIAPIDGRSHWSVGSANLPMVTKVSTGRYTITYATSYTDDLGTVETVAFYKAIGDVESLSTFGKVQCTVSGRIINVAVVDMAGTLSDLGGVTVSIEAK